MISNNCRIHWRALKIALFALFLLPGIAPAQYFAPQSTGSLLAGFRKTGSFAGQYEVVVYLGSITNFIGLPVGQTTNITVYGTSMLAYAFPSSNTNVANLGNLQWSVFAANNTASTYRTPVGSFPKATGWYTQARAEAGTQTAAPPRWNYNNQAVGLSGPIVSVITGAEAISQGLGATNAYNNTNLVVEPVATYATYILTESIGDTVIPDSAFGDFGGNCLDYSVENTTPNSFTSPAVSDFYQSCPQGETDPFSSTPTSGDCYYLGYFTLNVNGTMSFTRQANVAPYIPPPPPVLSIAHVGITNIISFGTTNGGTYTLIYNTLAGLSSPLHTWPILGSSITGTGGNTNFVDTTAPASGRVYSVTAH